MRNQSLQHELAFMGARKIASMMILDEENCRIVWTQLYEILLELLHGYEVKAERRHSRLQPSEN